MHGQKRTMLVLIQCRMCAKWIVLRVDPDDVLAFNEGMYIQDACPYLPPDLRELFISQTCGACWDLLCVDPIAHPTAYN